MLLSIVVLYKTTMKKQKTMAKGLTFHKGERIGLEKRKSPASEKIRTFLFSPIAIDSEM